MAVQLPETNLLTPMLRQYYDLKSQCLDSILFFRMGDFYEIFGDDAEKVAPELQLVLTSRERGDKNKIAFCGVPHHSAKNYYIKLLKRGYKIAIADQVSDPAESKGLVDRKIVSFLSPGCIDELECLDSSSSNYVLAVHQHPLEKRWSVVLFDVSTSEIRLGSAQDMTEIRDLIEQFQPKELWTRQFFQTQFQTSLKNTRSQLLFGVLSESALRDEESQKIILKEAFSSDNSLPQGEPSLKGHKEVLAACLTQLKLMGFSISRFLTVSSLRASNTLRLSENVIRDLELFETNLRREYKGSLLSVIDQTLSSMGARQLRRALCTPLCELAEIHRRQNLVGFFFDLGPEKLLKLRQIILGIADLRRLLTRVSSGKVSVNELQLLGQACRQIQMFNQALAENGFVPGDHKIIADLVKAEGAIVKIWSLVEGAFGLLAQTNGHKAGIFQNGYDAKLDELYEYVLQSQQLIDRYVESEKEKTSIGSLKARRHKTYGLLLEVTKSHSKKVPPHFVRRQTMVNGERFATPELETLTSQIDSASEQVAEREAQLFQEIIGQIQAHYEEGVKIAEAFGLGDMLLSFAWISHQEKYCRPLLAKASPLNLVGSRHPVVEKFVGKHNFRSNDIHLAVDKKHMVITGPNMGGKSTVMRQVALSAILAQIGCFVPATSAQMPIFDNVFTRVGASDNLSGGQSTFMVEMSEAAHILRNATSQSLVILDEVGRGTSTQDGLALASAILSALVGKIHSYTFFATHYHELVAFSSRFPAVQIFQTLVRGNGENIEFSHQLVPGASGNSYGIEVAKLAGIPQSVLDEAKKYLGESKGFNNAIHTFVESVEVPPPVSISENLPLEENFQFATGAMPRHKDSLAEIVERLELVRIHKTTPLQALTILNDLKSLLTTQTQQSEFNFHPEQHS